MMLNTSVANSMYEDKVEPSDSDLRAFWDTSSHKVSQSRQQVLLHLLANVLEGVTGRIPAHINCSTAMAAIHTYIIKQYIRSFMVCSEH